MSNSKEKLKEAYLKSRAEIAPHVKTLHEEMYAILKILEENGAPMYVPFSELGQVYSPASVLTKFPDLNSEEIGEITDWSSWHGHGWEHSAFC